MDTPSVPEQVCDGCGGEWQVRDALDMDWCLDCYFGYSEEWPEGLTPPDVDR